MSRAQDLKDRYDALNGKQPAPATIDEAKYTVAKMKTVKRASLEAGYGAAETIFVPDPETFGIHKSNIDAKRAMVIMDEPSLADSSDEHIKRVAKSYITGSMAHFKIVRV